MRYIKLYEDFSESSNFEKVIEFLEANCKEFLDELTNSKSKLLYRGVKNFDIEANYEIKTVRKDRRPMDMNKYVNEKLSKKFIEKFGISIRREGVFATKEIYDSTNYGYGCIFFPIGEYKYYYSNHFNDLFRHLDRKLWYKGVRLGYGAYWQYTSDGEYCLGNIRTFTKDIDRVVSVLRNCTDESVKDIINNMTADDIKAKLVLKDNMTEEEMDNYIDAESNRDIDDIVTGYIDYDLADVLKQEVVFVCDKYCLVNYEFNSQIEEYLRNRTL